MAAQPQINPCEAPQVDLSNDYIDNADDDWREGEPFLEGAMRRVL